MNEDTINVNETENTVRGRGRPKTRHTPTERKEQDILRHAGPIEAIKDSRPSRTPVAGSKDILTVHNTEKGYVYRWVNNVNNRLERFKNAGYEHVTHSVKIGDDSVNASTSKGGIVTHDVGRGVTAYLMRIREDWYNEDQQAKQIEVDELEAELNREVNQTTQHGRYGSVTIR